MNTKLTLLLLLFSIESLGQMRIDQIKTDADVIQFVADYGMKHNMDWRKVSFDWYTGRYGMLSDRDKIHIDSLRKNRWLKMDFNNDGKEDLIFSGRIYTEMATLAFISQNGDSISLQYLGESPSIYPTGISTYTFDKGPNLLLVNSFKRSTMSFDINDYHQDTLVYALGGFVEFNDKHEFQFDFDSIVYQAWSPWAASNTIRRITISENGLIRLYKYNMGQANDNSWPNGMRVFSASIGQLDTLRQILSIMRVKDLKSDYAVQWVSDLTTAETMIYYKNGVKKIRDYGMQGTYGLRLFYGKLQQITRSSLTRMNDSN